MHNPVGGTNAISEVLASKSPRDSYCRADTRVSKLGRPPKLHARNDFGEARLAPNESVGQDKSRNSMFSNASGALDGSVPHRTYCRKNVDSAPLRSPPVLLSLSLLQVTAQAGGPLEQGDWP